MGNLLSQRAKATITALCIGAALSSATAQQVSDNHGESKALIVDVISAAQACADATSLGGVDETVLTDRGWRGVMQGFGGAEVIYVSSDERSRIMIHAPVDKAEISKACIVSGRIPNDAFLTELTEGFHQAFAASEEIMEDSPLLIDGDAVIIASETRTNSTGSHLFFEVLIFDNGDSE